MSRSRAWVCLVLANLFWAGNYVAGAAVTQEMSPLWMTFWRWLLALVLLFPIAHWLEKPDWRKAFRSWLPLSLLGVLGITGYSVFLYAALSYTSATNAALVNALNPATIALCSGLILRETLSGRQVAGFLFSLMGVMVVLTRGEITQVLHLNYNTGDLLMLGAILVWTLYSVLGKRLSSVPPFTGTAVSSLFATGLLLPLALTHEMNVAELSISSLSAILYMAIFPSVGSYLLWNQSIRVVGANRAGISLNLIPVFTALIGLALGESVSGSQIVGGLMVFIGVILTATTAVREAPSSSPDTSGSAN